MRPADHQRLAVLQGLPSDRIDRGIEPRQELVDGVYRLHCQRGVDDVRAGQPEVDETRRLANGLAGRAQKGDHVVIGLALDLLHPLDITTRLTNGRHGGGRNDAAGCPCLADRLFDSEPLVDLVLLAPNRAHLGQGVAFDHACVPLPRCLSVVTSNWWV